MIWKAHWQKRGNHHHLFLFAGEPERTNINCGELVMTEKEFNDFRQHATFIEWYETGSKDASLR
jgi:hypothetical protein